MGRFQDAEGSPQRGGPQGAPNRSVCIWGCHALFPRTHTSYDGWEAQACFCYEEVHLGMCLVKNVVHVTVGAEAHTNVHLGVEDACFWCLPITVLIRPRTWCMAPQSWLGSSLQFTEKRAPFRFKKLPHCKCAANANRWCGWNAVSRGMVLSTVSEWQCRAMHLDQAGRNRLAETRLTQLSIV